MAKRQIQIKITKDGKIEGKTVNITGKKCENYIKYLEELTNAKVVESCYTEDFYKNEESDEVAQAADIEVKSL